MKALSRRRAREIALQVLYSVDANPDTDPRTALASYFHRFASEQSEDDEADTLDDAVDQSFVEGLVEDVSARRDELDEILGQVSRNWRIERIARVERSILRLAIFELKFRDDIPSRVTINEAIELAKRFGAEDASAFVNGLLDSALHSLGIAK